MNADTLPPVWSESVTIERESRVLILAPTSGDARVTAEFLSKAKIHFEITPDCAVLCNKVVEGCGALLLAEEVLNMASSQRIFDLLSTQPKWSDVPVILVTTSGAAGGARMHQLRERGFNINATVLERPFRPSTLTSTLDAALRNRRRQYEVRQLLRDLALARDAAEMASKAKDNFLAALSHELRTPLNPVLLLASEGAVNSRFTEEVRQDFSLIARNVELEARLIDDLLDVTRVTNGKLKLRVQELDTHEVLRETLHTTHSEFSAKRQIVSFDPGATQTTICADPVRIQQVFWNVLKNASKFTPMDGTVRVSTSNQGNAICIAIADTGVGLLAHELGQIFNAFVQGDHAGPNSRQRFEGLGLGLAITKHIVELHGGTIAASSAGPGHGSTFTMVLPLDAGKNRHEPELPGVIVTENVRARTPLHQVLLVEDHGATRKSLARILERRGYSVQVASSLAEARAQLCSNNIDLLISDIGLPDGTGHQLMSEFRDRPGLRGIAMSGYGSDTDLSESRQNGFSAHLTKPVSIRELEATLAILV